MSLLSEIWRGKDIYRLLMNSAASRYTVKGRVLDVGSGKTLASYHRFLNKEPNTQIDCLDLGFESGATGRQIDLEKDLLPYQDQSADFVLLFNLLEHIYNFQNILAESKRVLKPGGKILGVVPFLVGYHPDPHDYWRYTPESLAKIFAAAGLTQISVTPFGRGPATAAWSQFEVAVPRLLKIILAPLALFLDKIITSFKPKLNQEKFPLGYFFEVTR